jgi:hypothetical protein
VDRTPLIAFTDSVDRTPELSLRSRIPWTVKIGQNLCSKYDLFCRDIVSCLALLIQDSDGTLFMPVGLVVVAEISPSESVIFWFRGLSSWPVIIWIGQNRRCQGALEWLRPQKIWMENIYLYMH